MGEKMNKEQVIQATIGVLSDISVPVRLKDQVTAPIEGAINNLAIVLQMIQMENEASARHQEEPEAEVAEAGDEEAWNGGNAKHYEDSEPGAEPLVKELKPEDVGCPEEEAAEDGHEADAE